MKLKNRNENEVFLQLHVFIGNSGSVEFSLCHHCIFICICQLPSSTFDYQKFEHNCLSYTVHSRILFACKFSIKEIVIYFNFFIVLQNLILQN